MVDRIDEMHRFSSSMTMTKSLARIVGISDEMRGGNIGDAFFCV